MTGLDQAYHARLVTNVALFIILAIGWTKGFQALERLEQITVEIKFSIIAGLIVGLVIYFGDDAQTGGLAFEPPTVSGWPAFALMAGLIVTVQGFETSRYLRDSYSAATRIRSMRLAQWTASAI